MDADLFEAVVCSLVVEHVRELQAFFEKLALVCRKGAEVLISEIHPARIKAGTQANFLSTSLDSIEESYVMESHVHSASAIEKAASDAGFLFKFGQEIYGDEKFAQLNPDWVKHVGQPLIQIWKFEKLGG